MSDIILYRRHTAECPSEHRDQTDCRCAVWCDGIVAGRRFRRSLKTTDWGRAERKLARLTDPEAPPPSITIADATTEFIHDCETRRLAAGTIRSYSNTLADFVAHCGAHAYTSAPMLDLAAFACFREARAAAGCTGGTLNKETQILRAWCAWCVEREWMTRNWAKMLRRVRDRHAPTVPFTQAEVSAVLKSCSSLRADPARRINTAQRARAVVLLLLYSGLRISDAATLERSRLGADGRLLLCMMKTGSPLYVRLPDHVAAELRMLPGDRYFFWNGGSTAETMALILRRTIASVCRKAGITNGHPHRFRDTFAVRLLENDVPIRTVQLLLGHTSVQTTEKHYAPFVRSQQRLLDTAVATLDFAAPSRNTPGAGVRRGVKSAGQPRRRAAAGT